MAIAELSPGKRNRTKNKIEQGKGYLLTDFGHVFVMAAIKVEKNSPAFVQRSKLQIYREALSNFLELTRSSCSPKGKIKILQNTSGGSMTLTSSSKRLLQSLSVRKPVIQLLVTSTQGHLSAYSDGGLLLATFAADLVLISMDCKHNSKLLSEIYETFLTLCLEHLSSPDCTFRYKAMMSNIDFMRSFVKSILGTKSLCEWNEERLCYISKLILETFLQSVSDERYSLNVCDNVYTITSSGLDVLESRTESGLLLPAPELSKFRKQDFKFARQGESKHIKVALVTASLSGDLDELSSVNYKVSQDVDIDAVILEGLSDFCDALVQSDVRLVLCQKVVHPKLKLSLRKSGVIVVDRLGLQPVKYITTLTGCLPIQNLDDSTSEKCYGYVDSVQHEIIHKKSYLHLQRADNCVSTLVLCHYHDQPLFELKDVCETCLDGLQQLLYNPAVLAGGGCWQVALANYLRTKVDVDKEKLSKDLDCPVSLIKDAAVYFTQALVRAAVGGFHGYKISKSSGHLFRHAGIHASETDDFQLCCCGICEAKSGVEFVTSVNSQDVCFETDLIKNEYVPLPDVIDKRNVVLDSFLMCVNVLQTAVLTACTILRIGQVVENL